MSTLKRTPRLLTLTIATSLGLGISGCASSPGQPRAGALSRIKTYLAVGEKPLPVVSGEPGSTVSAAEPSDVDPPSPRRGGKPDGRISGRVYDPDGRPVADARVRLAISGAAGGKVVRTSTDRSGAFTLHGLRLGSNYTLIAEWEDEEGPMTGRVNASTDDNEVKITLVAPDEPKNLRAAAPSRVNKVSEREQSVDQDPEEEGANLPPALSRDHDEETSLGRDDSRSVAVNEEDLPPAQEAERVAPLAPRRNPPTASIGASVSRSTNGNAWRSGTSIAKPGKVDADPADPGNRRTLEPGADDAPIDRETRGTSAMIPEDEDGPNPLPPALERIEEPASEPEPATSRAPKRRRGPKPEPRIDAATEPTPIPEPDPFEVRPPALAAMETPRAQVGDSAPGALVVVPETFGPLVFKDDPFASQPPPALGRTEPMTTAVPEAPEEPVAKTPKTRSPLALARRETPRAEPRSNRPQVDEAPVAKKPVSRAPRKPTWGDLSARNLPPLESDSMTATTRDAKADPGVSRRSYGLKIDPIATSAVPSSLSKNTKNFEASCDYDDRHRRIIDFRLPDLDGNAVSFKDIDADLILLDFWGTWCQPCLRSVPHLVELQERMGKKIAVVGIACEPEPRKDAVSRINSTVEKYKVNYPILMSKNSGACPLQEALHISAFPTLVLVDRQGRIIWRDQGSTPATLARLDRVLATPSHPETR